MLESQTKKPEVEQQTKPTVAGRDNTLVKLESAKDRSDYSLMNTLNEAVTLGDVSPKPQEADKDEKTDAARCAALRACAGLHTDAGSIQMDMLKSMRKSVLTLSCVCSSCSQHPGEEPMCTLRRP